MAAGREIRSMREIAVVGVGAIGGVVAAHLGTAGRDIILCVRQPLDELTLETPRRTSRISLPVVSAPEEVPPVRWILLATKAHQTDGAAAWLRALAGAGTTVILQNGVEHVERVAPYATGAVLLPAVVECSAAKLAPGRVLQRTPAEITVPATKAGRDLALLFGGTEVRITVTDDFVTAAWRKLCVNVAGGAITVLTDRELGVMRRPEVARLAGDLVRECIAVGRAEGAKLSDALANEIVASMLATPESGTSMLADRRAGKPLEADARNGAVQRIGIRHGIDTPLNHAMTAILNAINQDD